MQVRPTGRGVALVLAGFALTGLGIALGAIDLVTIGTVLVLVVVAGALAVGFSDPHRGRHRLLISREVRPDPVHAGNDATVTVTVTASDATGRSRLADLELREQAAAQLSGGRPLRARVTRAPGSVVLRYPVEAERRGRWPLGPLAVSRTDPFGLVRTRTVLGDERDLVVWPAVTTLPAARVLLVGEPDRAVAGVRTPSSDDTALRDYRVGDDLRRVHWPSSARRGELVIRADERAGVRPVTVVVDLPGPGDALEWSVSLSLSVALAMIDAGRAVRLATCTPADLDPTALHALSGPDGRARLLDTSIDLEGTGVVEEAERQLLATVRGLGDGALDLGHVIAVVGPLGEDARTALARLSGSAPAWAVVRTHDERGDGTATARALEHAGWHVALAEAGADLAETWRRLLGSRA